MKHSKELKIGIFVVVTLVVAFFVINYLRGKDLFGKEIEVKGYYENVHGLVPSAPVEIKGFQVGSVKEVNYLEKEGRFEVICSVQKQFAVKTDGKMVIYAVDIMGGKGVRIEQGTAQELAKNGTVLESAYEEGLLDMLGGVVGPLVDNVNGAIDSLKVAMSGVNNLIASIDPQSISRTVKHLEATMANVRSLSRSIEGKSDEVSALVDNLAAVSEQLKGVMAKADTTVDGVNNFLGTLNEADVEGLVGSFKALLDKVQDPDGSLGKLIANDGVYNEIESLLADVDALVAAIKDNPKKYIKISIF